MIWVELKNILCFAEICGLRVRIENDKINFVEFSVNFDALSEKQMNMIKWGDVYKSI